MKLTVSKLRGNLDKKGISLTERILTDWRSKELLPPLTRKGKGILKGTENYWEQPHIFKQAYTIFQLMPYVNRVGELFIPLYLLGFEVPIDMVRLELDRWSKKRIIELNPNNSPQEELEFLMEGKADQIARYTPKEEKTKLSLDSIQYMSQMLLNLYVNSNFKLDELRLIELVLELRTGMELTNLEFGNSSTLPSQSQLKKYGEKIYLAIQKYASLPNLNLLINKASNEKYEQAKKDFLEVKNFVKIFYLKVCSDEVKTLVIREKQDLLKVFIKLSPLFLALDISLRMQDLETNLNQILSTLEKSNFLEDPNEVEEMKIKLSEYYRRSTN